MMSKFWLYFFVFAVTLHISLSCDCGPNEELIYAEYEDATCDAPQKKTCEGVEACRCIEGYVRFKGKCIDACDCPKSCKDPNEEYILAKFEDATCDNPKRKSCRPVKACRCKDGFVRQKGKCIKESDCPSKCKDPNEIWVKGATFEDATCDNPKRKKCKAVDACRCKDGFVRNKGVCIKESDCPSKCKDPNEIWVKGATFEDATCDDPKKKKCKAVDACRCKDGFVRNKGVCIKESDCPSKCKDPNEIWVKGADYLDGTCSNPLKKAIEPVDACRCKDGFVRYKNQCIKESDCPSKCKDPNEIWVVGADYEDGTCSNPLKKAIEPVDACRCKDGFVRYKKQCIKESDCPPKCKDPNEIWVIDAEYEDGTCSDPKRRTCDPITACRCKDGFVRYKKQCIKESDCPVKCKDPNEIWVIDAEYEDGTCSDPKRRTCDPITACRCKDGFVRYKKQCIKDSDCPAKCKDPNEIWVVGAEYEDGTCSDPQKRTCEPVDACRCKDGFVRYKKQCIKESDCPSKCKDPNEIWVVGAEYEDGTCSNPQKRTCEPVDACRCKDGFVRYKKQCIKESDCPVKCKDPNEIWVIDAEYEDGTCSDPKRRTCDPISACRCKDGFVRYKKTCIKESDCPAKCSDPNEIWVIGAEYEDGTCNNPQKRTCDPVNACRCIDGFVRYKGKCIKESDCPTKCKGQNEVFVKQADYEDGTCRNPKKRAIEPEDGCRCIDGFVRYKGQCIKECDCPVKCTDPNEIWVVGAEYEDATCSNPEKRICDPVDACRCVDGFVRYKGKCIKDTDCPVRCKGQNEVFVRKADYEDGTCRNPKRRAIDPEDGCRCIDGFVRYKGQCIKECDCPVKCTDPNEIWVVGAEYEDATCSNPEKRICDPVDACRCVDGFVRYKGKCIKDTDCPVRCKGQNEVFVRKADYEDGTCRNPKRRAIDPEDGCRCIDGFVRYKGQCIKECDCPVKCTDPNEIWVVNAEYEDATCSNPEKRICEPVDACRCKDGFVRYKKQCIKESDCPIRCKGANEIFVKQAEYLDGTCRNPQRKSSDPEDGCRCIDGFVRYKGQCIKESDCPAKCSDPYEIWVVNAEYEDATCSNPEKRICDPVDACRCVDGFLRYKGKCIKPSGCPTKCKGANEIWVKGAEYEDGTCRNPQRKSCDPEDGCRCIDGFVRYKGQCIKESDCPSKCKDPNEVWVVGAEYEDATCSNLEKRICDPVDACRCKDGFVRYKGQCIKLSDCPTRCKGANEIWVKGAEYEDGTCRNPQRKSSDPEDGCRCIEGFVRYKGQCIKECDCPVKCKDPNEVWVVGAEYEDATCNNAEKRICDPVDACRCKDGFVRYKGKCIKTSECPAKCKGENEIWVPFADYEDGTCGDPKKRPSEPEDGCRCIDGYVRFKGKCIKESDCPAKCKDPNEIWVKNASYEDATCNDNKRRKCKPVDACRCIDGYVRHEDKCIKESDCPAKCKDPNEIWVEGARYEDATCDDPERRKCKAIDACRCKDGFVRFEGKCIKDTDCPAKCKDPNEIWVRGATYEDPTCEDPKRRSCKAIDACRCKKGFVRLNGKCIRECDCPPKCKDPNEKWVIDANYMDATCDNPIQNKCKPVNACRCKDGYLRFEGKCIKKCHCPVKCQDPNEEYVKATTAEPTCWCQNPDPCEPVEECRCKKGYVRYEGSCIPACDCPTLE